MYFLFRSYFSQLNQEVQPDLVELPQPSSKEYDSDYSDDEDNEMDELSVDQKIFLLF
jgi:hypothetical protein